MIGVGALATTAAWMVTRNEADDLQQTLQDEAGNLEPCRGAVSADCENLVALRERQDALGVATLTFAFVEVASVAAMLGLLLAWDAARPQVVVTPTQDGAAFMVGGAF